MQCQLFFHLFKSKGLENLAEYFLDDAGFWCTMAHNSSKCYVLKQQHALSIGQSAHFSWLPYTGIFFWEVLEIHSNTHFSTHYLVYCLEFIGVSPYHVGPIWIWSLTEILTLVSGIWYAGWKNESITWCRCKGNMFCCSGLVA